MKVISFKKVCFMFALLLIFSILYIISFHFSIFNYTNVYIYNGLINLITITIIMGFLCFLLYRKKAINLDFKDCIITILLFFSINIFFFCMVPVTLERSISVFMLNELNQENGLTKEELERNFINKYVYKYDAFNKRFNEQKYLNTIQRKDEKYILSKKGKALLNKFKIIKKIYHVNSRILR